MAYNIVGFDSYPNEKAQIQQAMANLMSIPELKNIIDKIPNFNIERVFNHPVGHHADNGNVYIDAGSAYFDNTTGTFKINDFDGFGSIVSRPIERIIFHEIVHVLTDDVSMPGGVSYDTLTSKNIPMAEQIAIFAENVLYAEETGSVERFGHSRNPSDLDGYGDSVGIASGTAAFNWLSSSSGVDIISNGSDRVIFRKESDDGNFFVEKTYISPGSVGGINNYAGVHLFNEFGISSFSYGTVDVLSTMMGGDGYSGAIGLANGLMNDVLFFGIDTDASTNQKNLMGLSAEWFRSASTASDNIYTIGVGYQNVEPGSATPGTLDEIDVIPIVAVLNEGAIIVGASGEEFSQGASDEIYGTEYGDFIFSSNANANNRNELYGKSGDDVIVGSDGEDSINGGADNDVIFGRGGNDIIDGGSGDDLVSYRSLNGAITYGVAGGTVGAVEKTDELSNVESIIGSTFNDTFYGGAGAEGSHLYGAEGSDVFFIGGSDHFYGYYGSVNDLDVVSAVFSDAGVEFDLGAGTVAGNHFSGMEKIVGSDHADYFKAAAHGAAYHERTSAYGGDGDDVFEMDNGMSAYGGEGSDTIKILRDWFGVIDGGDGVGVDTLDFSGMNGEGLVLDLETMKLRFHYSEEEHDVSSFEKFDFSNNLYEINGTSSSDTIDGREYKSENNTSYYSGKINGGSGNDIITGGYGDKVYGGNGEDNITLTGAGYTEAHGGSNNDHLKMSSDVQYGHIFGDGGDDILEGNGFSNTMWGGSHDDVMMGYGGNDNFHPGSGEDAVNGGQGYDSVFYEYQPSNGLGTELIAIEQLIDGSFAVRSSSDGGVTIQTDILIGVEAVMFYDSQPDVSYSGWSLYDGFFYYAPGYGPQSATTTSTELALMPETPFAQSFDDGSIPPYDDPMNELNGYGMPTWEKASIQEMDYHLV